MKKLVECHLRSKPNYSCEFGKEALYNVEGKIKLLFWPVFVLPKAMPPAYDSLFHPRFKIFTVNSRHNGSQKGLLHFVYFIIDQLIEKIVKRKK